MEQHSNDESQHKNSPTGIKKPGKGPITALVIVIVLSIAAIGGTWYYMNNQSKNDKKAQDSQIQQLQKQVDDLKKQSATKDETADWNTYNDTYDKISFKYPKDWKLTTTDRTAEMKKDMPEWKGPFINAVVTSPSGFKIALDTHLTGIGGACGASLADCPQNQFVSKEKITTLSNGVELYLVKYQMYDPSGKELMDRKIGFIGIDPKAEIKQSLENYQGHPPYFLFISPGVDGAFTGFADVYQGSGAKYQPNLTAAQYFAQPDLQTAEKIFKTIKQI